MEGWLQEVRHGLRSLGRARGFTVAALLALALGIGANTAIFSVVHGVLLEPLPYRDANRIVTLWVQFLGQDLPELKLSPPEYVDFESQATVFDELTPTYGWEFNVTGDGEPERVKGAVTSASLFEVLGVQALLGRPFSAEEDTAGNDDVVVLSEALWKRRYGGDRDVLGETVTLNGSSFAIVGVMPSGFAYPSEDTQLWIPLAFDLESQGGRWAHYLSVVGRLKDGVSLQQAQTEVSTIAQRMQDAYQKEGFYAEDSGWGAFVRPLREELVGDVKPALLVLFAAVSLVLLIACSNVANLLLARSETRYREIGVRAAIGAGRWRILRQLMTENLILAIGGGVVGLFVAYLGVRVLVALAPPELPSLAPSSLLDGQVLLYTLGISLVTGLICGLLPAARATRVDLHKALKEGSRGTTGHSGLGLKRALVVVEVALSLILLVGAGLLIRSFVKLSSVDPGFDADQVLTMKLNLPRSSYGEGVEQARFYQQLLDRVDTLAGVEVAGAISHLPLSGDRWTGNISFGDRPNDPDSVPPEVDWRAISSGYPSVMKIPLLQGRLLTDRDIADNPQVALVDEALADRFWPDGSPLHKRVKLGGPDSSNPWREIVGVVGTVKHGALSEESRGTVYVPHLQNNQSAMTLVVRSQIDPSSQVTAVKSVVHDLDANLPVSRVVTMASLLDESLSAARFNLLLLGVLAGLALVLAIVGIYAVISYGVKQRAHEIGIRMALGAERGRVTGMVVREGAVLAVIGLVCGAVGALLLSRSMSSLLYGVTSTDTLTYAGVALFVLLVSLGASLIPAWRASHLDPVVALRES